MVSSYLEILLLSFYVSGTALVISSIIGIPLGAWIGFRAFQGTQICHCAALYRDGLASGGGWLVRLPVAFPFQFPRQAQSCHCTAAFHPIRDDPGRSDHCPATGLRVDDVGGDGRTRGDAVPDPLAGREQRADCKSHSLGSTQGGDPGGDRRFRKHHFRGRGGDAGGGQRGGADARAHHRHRVGDTQGEFLTRHVAGIYPAGNRLSDQPDGAPAAGKDG